MTDRAKVTILGARGSVPVAGERVSRYGGATACVLVELGGEVLVLDGGTGILELTRYLRPEEKTLHLLLSHTHIDHILGLPAWAPLFDPSFAAHVYTATREGLSPLQQLQRLMTPPLWPVQPEQFCARMTYHTVQGPFSVGAVEVRVLEGAHPGGCTVFRLDCGGKSVVYASDYELNETSFAPLAAFAKDCSLLLCDGQYTAQELERRRGFGHSAWTDAARLAARCGAARLRILHHAPWRSDEELDQYGAALAGLCQTGAFGCVGEELYL